MRRSVGISVVLTTATLIGCGTQSRKSGNEDAKAAELVGYNIGLTQIKGLSLTDAESFSMEVDGCASGYTNQASETTGSLKVYQYDQGCLAKLAVLSVNGDTYEPSQEDPFETWLPGDRAKFVSISDPTHFLWVQVINQIDSPVPKTVPSHGVDYAYSEVQLGTDENIGDDIVGNRYTISVSGMSAPAFDIATVEYVGMTMNGAGEFVLRLGCQQPVEGAEDQTSCANFNMTQIKYQLFADTFNGMLTLDQADDLFNTNPVYTVEPSDVLPAGTEGVPNGGFITKLGADALKSPDRMHLNPNMLLVLQGAATSYKYWNVDVTPLMFKAPKN